MGLFDEQIRLRKAQDQEIFEDAILEVASVIADKHGAGDLRDKRVVTNAAIDDILKYHGFKPVDIPDFVEAAEAQLDYALKPYGLMYRYITLSENWYKDSFSPIMAFNKEDGLPVVLLPKRYGGYCWYDADGKRVTANKATAERFSPEAICFYKPLPLKEIGIPELLSYMKSCLNWADFAVLVGMALLVTAVGVLIPRITKMLSGFVLESGSGLILWSTAIFMLCVLVSSQFLTAARELAMARIQTKAAVPMEAAIMARLMSLPTSFFRKYNAGELASRSGAMGKLCTLLLGGVFSAGVTALLSLLYVNQIFSYAPALGLPALAVNIMMVAVTVLTGFMKMKEAREYMNGAAEEAGVSYAIISGIQKIKLSGAEKRAFAKWAKVYASGAEIEYNPPLFLKINSAIMLAVSLSGTIILYYLAVTSGVSPSAYLAFTAAYGAVTGAFTAFSAIAASAAQIKPILEMAEPILKTEPETTEGKEIVTKLSGSIELNNVFFRYNDTQPYVINGLDLKIKAGEYVAVVGKTGCGKSTLLRLLLGFETPEKGAIYYDRKDLRSLDLVSLRRKMGVVTQDGSLFHGDIYSNITVSAPHLTLDEVWEAAEKADIADDIRAMPMGMQTFISEGQGGISGGQRQRLMIARAIAPKPKILLFDEATSALDNKTQKQVAGALAELDCTRVVIAHRLSTVKDCDRILVMDDGKIIEQGDYAALIAKGGFFAELVERQRIDLQHVNREITPDIGV
ncbi:MAG: ATP-binding cassette domain-containing protein [Clostridia bacterium]|nr:ATP-binding cassette domain-containing protein [Clostridia bacterium]